MSHHDNFSHRNSAIDEPSTACHPVSPKAVAARAIQPNMEVTPTSASLCNASFVDASQRESHKASTAVSGTPKSAGKVAEASFNPPKGPRSMAQNAALNEDRIRSAKGPLDGCDCQLPSFFTANYHRIPNLKNWPGEKEDFIRHVRSIANCRFHPFEVKGACRNIVKSHEAGLARKNEAQLFSTTDLSKGIFSNGSGRYVVHRGRSQSTIAPDNFYVSARNANQGEPARGLGPKADVSNISATSQQCTPTSLSPDYVGTGSPTVSHYRRHETPFLGPRKSHSLANGTSASRVASMRDSVDSIYQPASQSPSDSSSEFNGPSTPKMESLSAVRKSNGEKEVEGVIDWAMNCLERDLASSHSPQWMIQDDGPIEDDSSTHVSPKKPDQLLQRQSPLDFARKARRHQSLPARLATPAPAAVKPAQTPGDRVKAFAREHLAKVPNLSLVDIKRVVEELDRRLTDIEADKEASRSMRSSDRPKVVTPSNIIHYSSSKGFRDATSACTSGASANASSSTSMATPASGFVPVNQPVSNTRESTNAMPPPPLPPKRKTKSIAEQKLEKPELSPDVPQHERLPEADIIDLGRRKLAYTRHESAPYAFNYRGKLRKDYRYLLTKVGPDGKTVWIAEEVARLS